MTTVTNKNGIEFDIDALATDVNGKMDKDGVNATCPVVISRTPNEQGGVVEIWSDGYCVQTGRKSQTIGTGDTSFSITLDQAYKDTTYIPIVKVFGGYAASNVINVEGKSVSSFSGYSRSQASSTKTIEWRTEGYIR